MKEEVPYKNNEKRQAIIDYIQEHEPVTQPEITEHFLTEFAYKTKRSARVSISRILKSLSEADKLQKEKKLNKSSGALAMNEWSIKRD